MEVDYRADANEAATIKEGREFFNEKPPAGYYRPYVYPHPLQEGWEALMKSVAGAAAFAATPVDIYQDMESGANGDVLTPDMRWIRFGRADNHGPNPAAKTQSYFEHILIDYTRGVFPLVPGHEAPTTSP
jgi:hypothetical protein